MEYKILDYNEGMFELNSEFEMPKDSPTEISLMIAPVFLYKDDSDIVGLQFSLFYKAGDVELLKYGYVATVAVKDWQSIAADGVNASEIATELKDAWDAVLNYGRGSLTSRTKDTQLSGLRIPDIPLEQMQKIIRVVKM